MCTKSSKIKMDQLVILKCVVLPFAWFEVEFFTFSKMERVFFAFFSRTRLVILAQFSQWLYWCSILVIFVVNKTNWNNLYQLRVNHCMADEPLFDLWFVFDVWMWIFRMGILRWSVLKLAHIYISKINEGTQGNGSFT